MQVQNIINEALNQQKTFFDATYNSILITQGQAEKMATDFLGQANLPSEGLETFKSAITECSKNRDSIKKIIDDNYDIIKTFFV